MEVKKKNFLENLRLKTKLGNKKKPGRKPLAKQKRNLASRRSISVPDLRLVPGEAFSAENALESGASDAIFFSVSPGVSDTDSIASGSVTDGPLCTDRLCDSGPEPVLRVHADHTAAALNRLSAPVETLTLYEETDDVIKSNSENKINLTQETLYAQVNKRAQINAATFNFDSVPATRHVLSNTQILSPIPDLAERESLSGGKESTSEDTPVNTRVLSGPVASALVRAHSLGEQGKPYIEKKEISSERGTPPTIRLTLDMLGTPLENADGTSLDSACGTPSEEQVSMHWTDSEEPEREPSSPFVTRELLMEEALAEETQSEEAQGEMVEVSFDMSVLLLLDVYTAAF